MRYHPLRKLAPVAVVLTASWLPGCADDTPTTASPAAAASPSTATSTSPGPVDDSGPALGDRLIVLINAERQKANLPALKVQPELAELARARAGQIAENGTPAQARAKGARKTGDEKVLPLKDRAETLGYRPRAIEEIATRAAGPVERVFQAMMADPKSEYRRKVVGDWADIGAAEARDGSGILYVAIVFASPDPGAGPAKGEGQPAEAKDD